MPANWQMGFNSAFKGLNKQKQRVGATARMIHEVQGVSFSCLIDNCRPDALPAFRRTPRVGEF
jgi:hypothetical protein